METKNGRPRVYKDALHGFEHLASAEHFSGGLRELKERVKDQLSGLDDAVLQFKPQGTEITIAWLAAHLVWAELGLVHKIAGKPVPEDWIRALPSDVLGYQNAGASVSLSSTELIHLIDRLSDECTDRILPEVPDLACRPDGLPGQMSFQELLLHLMWHWTYHSGQIGILMLQAGKDYVWSF